MLYLTKELVASFFEVDIRTIERYISKFGDELKANGMEILKDKKLESFIQTYNDTFATDINVCHKIRSMTVFNFRAFLDIWELQRILRLSPKTSAIMWQPERLIKSYYIKL